MVVVTDGTVRFLTDTRYAEQARDEVSAPYRVKIYKNKKVLDVVAGIVAALGLKVVGFSGDNLIYNAYLSMRKALKGVRLVNASGLVARLRASKDTLEADLVRDSARLLDKGFGKAAGLVKAGAVESDVAFTLEFFFKMRGADELAFDTIVASGARGALPHGKASDKRIRKGEFVVVDMGVIKKGYNSDSTRTFCVGRATKRHKEIYRTVLEAQARAIEKVRAGVEASIVDRAARNYIRKAGYGKFFGHATGHGVGLEIHESPYVGPKSRDVLTEGMVITIEPGIYIPGWGGVRIEDMVLVTRGGCEVLTNSTRELTCL